MAHTFNPSNEEGTCLWCGEKLRPNYSRGDRIEGKPKRIDGEQYGVEDYTIPTWKYINKRILGYGLENNGFFCTLFCSKQFGTALARMGRRLEKTP